jgi:hypothetical protein
MNEQNRSIVQHWQPPPRPEWLQRFLEETQSWERSAVAPLDLDELIATAQRSTGLSDFGDDDWREPFEILVRAVEEEADLHFFGRLWTRQDFILLLETRLKIEATYKANPEIEDVVIDRPVFITGMPRSGTSILFELLAQDERFLAPANWEYVLPCPPPEAATYRTDPRVPRAHDLITQMCRVAPNYQTMHELGAWIPNECGVSMRLSFLSQHLTAYFQVPTYTNWLFGADQTPAYRYHKRLLKLLQWKNPRENWLLKDPAHQSFLPTLFEVFPDARVIVTHRDPLKAQGSVTNLLGTHYWMRSDKPFDARAFEQLLTPEGTAARLDKMIDWIENGSVPADQIAHGRYADLVAAPLPTLEQLYGDLGIPFTQHAREEVEAYLKHKPKGKFGVHHYKVDRQDRTRALFTRYQQYFDVPTED